jgi:hypothetical protein
MSTPHASHVACEVGRFYLVPCLFIPAEWSTAWMPDDGWVPTIGPKHSDPDHLKFEVDHFHIDWRFIGDEQLRYASFWNGFPHGNVISSVEGRNVIKSHPVLKRRKCRRDMPEFPVVGASMHIESRRKWQALEKAQFAGCNKLKPGNICPHRGIDLTPFRQPDGTAVCPGHGLRWNLDTGELMRRHTPDGTQAPGATPGTDE